MPQTIHLRSRGAEAAISTLGAEPVLWRTSGRELLWHGDPAFWPRISPVLFPVVGRTRDGRIRVDGRAFPMDIHGFAPESDFAVASHEPGSVRLVLKDDAGTRARFPFAFALAVEYRLAGRALDAHFSLANPGPQPLPFALGFHPGFRWPFAGGRKEDYSVLFAEAEDPNVPVITREGLFSAATRRVPLEGRRLPFDETVFAQEALCFLGAKSRSLRFVAGDGSAISMALEDFPHLALWSRPGAGFVCMEAWTGHGDPDGFAGDLTDKPSMRLLAPGASSHHAVRLAFHPAGTVEEPER